MSEKIDEHIKKWIEYRNNQWVEFQINWSQAVINCQQNIDIYEALLLSGEFTESEQVTFRSKLEKFRIRLAFLKGKLWK